MRDRATRRRVTRTQLATRTAERVQVATWRRQGRLTVLGQLSERAVRLSLSRRLLTALLEELQISDDFDVLVGRVAHVPASQFPRLLVIALLLRHSWCPHDLLRTASRLGLTHTRASSETQLTPTTPRPRDRRQRRRGAISASPRGPRPHR